MKILPLGVSFYAEMLNVVMTSVDLPKRRGANDLCLIGHCQNQKMQLIRNYKKL